MSYILFDGEFDKILTGELKKEDIEKPERIALFTWTGEDIKILMDKQKKHIKLNDIIEKIRKHIENCDCAVCIETALYDILGD